MSLASRKLQLGVTLSRGLGAGSKPEIGRAAAEEQLQDILNLLEGSDMLFVTAGMGGGTGTGAAPVIARAARESGILTVGVVTKPFNFEGGQRMRQAESGIAELQQYVDTLIVIPNQNLFRVANERTTFAEAFRMADEVLHSGVRGITDLMVMPGFMNLDFADVKTVMSEMGKAMMGTGEADGDNRALRAAEAAIANPLLDDISMKGARGVLINITGGLDMTLFEMDQAANRIKEEVDPDAQIKVGSTLGENLEGRIRVSIIATGIDAALAEQQKQRANAAAGKAPTATPQRAATTNETAARRSPPMAAPAMPPKPTAPVATASVNVASSYFTMPAMMATPATNAPQTRATPILPLEMQEEPEIVDDEPEPMPSARTEGRFDSDRSMTTASPASTQPFGGRADAMARPEPMDRMAGPRDTRLDNGLDRAMENRSMDMRDDRSQRAAPQRTLQPARTLSKDDPDLRMTQLTTGNAGTTTAEGGTSHRNPRAQSLFRRITGFGMIRPSAAREEEDEEEDIATSAQPTQGRLDIDPSDRPALSTSAPETASDILDIPAFLRRQTNH
jgi:cell division protein FtsZ